MTCRSLRPTLAWPVTTLPSLPPKRPRAVRQVEAAYLTALALIALLAMSGAFTAERSLQVLRHAAETTNVAGRQRMLSQRIVVLSLTPARETGDESLGARLGQFEREHERLFRGDLAAFAASLSPERRAALDAAAARLAEVASKAANATARRGLAPEDAAKLRACSDEFLERMDRAVDVYSAASDETVETTRLYVGLFGLLALGLLLLEARFLFLPLCRSLTESIQEQDRLLRQSRASDARYRRAVLSAGVGLWDWDAHDACFRFSSRATALLGLDESETHTAAAGLGAFRPDAQHRLRRAIDGADHGYVQLDAALRYDGGWVRVEGTRDGEGNLTGTIVDIDASRRRRNELDRRLSMRAITPDAVPVDRTLVRGMVHDFRNYLHVIQISAELLAEDARVRDDALTIRAAADQAAELAHRFLVVGDEGEPRRSGELDAGSILRAMEALLRTLLTAEQRLVLEVADGLPVVQADEVSLRQVVVNLVINARDALEGRGTVTLLASSNAAGELVVEVADDGPGMSEEVRARALEPGFTTKARHGTGLGLAMVERTVRDMGGDFELESAVGEGTRARFRLR